MKMDVELQSFMYDVLDEQLNQTSSHRTDLNKKQNQSLNYILDLDKNPNVVQKFFSVIDKYSFIQVESMDQKKFSKWNMLFGLKKPASFQIKIKDLKDVSYSYEDDYTMMNFIFGGRKFKLPIEKISKEIFE